MNHYLSLRLKLDEIIKDEAFEKKVLENIRYCNNIVGKSFRVILWNENVTEKQCEDFVKRNEKLLFEVHTKITKQFDYVWFLIESKGDNSKWRYKSGNESILSGIVEYLKLVKILINRNRA
tara:strand:- start:237 stop:599 length:363 start_codon:yes stop_codon:yes gene_type:complete